MQALIEACIVDDDKLYWCVSSPTMKDKPVSINRRTFFRFSQSECYYCQSPISQRLPDIHKGFFQNASLITMSNVEIEIVMAKFLLTDLYSQRF